VRSPRMSILPFLLLSACSATPANIRPDNATIHDPQPVAMPAASAVASGSASPASSSTAPATSFRLPPGTEPEKVWGDGDLMVVRVHESFDAVLMAVPRNGPSVPGPKVGATRCTFAGAGTTRTAVLAGDGGMMARFSGSSWERFLAPALDAEPIGGVAIDSHGRVIAAGQHHALYVLDGSTWKIERYPSAGMSIVSIAIDRDDSVYLVGSAGRLVSYAGGTFRDLSVSGLASGALTTHWVDAWLSRRTRTLWIAAERALVGIDLATSTARTVPTERALFFDVDGMTGISVGATDLLALSSFGDGVLFDGTTFFKVDGARHAGFLDPKDRVIYGTDDGLTVSPLVHPSLGNGRGTPASP
jgi:hypothetical protein